MIIVVRDFQRYRDEYKNFQCDLIGDLGDPDVSRMDTTKYLYYIVSHTVANINLKFSDIEKARRFALDFDAKNRANGYTTYNIDNIVGVKAREINNISQMSCKDYMLVEEMLSPNSVPLGTQYEDCVPKGTP